jgi:hypothetical protein
MTMILLARQNEACILSSPIVILIALPPKGP